MNARRLAVILFLVVGIVLSSLRAMAATVAVLVAYGRAVGPSTTTRLAVVVSVRREPGIAIRALFR